MNSYSITCSKLAIINIAKYLEQKEDLKNDDIIAIVSEVSYDDPKETFEVSVSEIII